MHRRLICRGHQGTAETNPCPGGSVRRGIVKELSRPGRGYSPTVRSARRPGLKEKQEWSIPPLRVSNKRDARLTSHWEGRGMFPRRIPRKIHNSLPRTRRNAPRAGCCFRFFVMRCVFFQNSDLPKGKMWTAADIANKNPVNRTFVTIRKGHFPV